MLGCGVGDGMRLSYLLALVRVNGWERWGWWDGIRYEIQQLGKGEQREI